jgi:hypothetical protein
MENHSTAETRETLVRDLSNLKRDVTQIANDVREHSGAHVDAAKKHLADQVQSLRDAVSRQPLVLLGTGILIGFFLASRRRR